MPVYHISTRISSNACIINLLYDLSIYRMNSERNKTCLVDVKQQPVQENYQTQKHMTANINESLSTIYIMEVTLYRKTMLKTLCVTPIPFTRMYTHRELAAGKSWSPVKRENPCYFESTVNPKPMSEGGETKGIIISIPERPFVAKEYSIGSDLDPFEKNRIEQQINNRFNHYDFPNQNAGSLCGPAVFFYCLQKDRPDVYAQAVRELWKYGKTKIGELTIEPSERCLHPSSQFYYSKRRPKIMGIDWMTLAGLRDSENTVFSFDALDSPIAGITMWQILSEWFEKVGYEKVFSNVGITQAGIQGIHDLNAYQKKGYKVVTLINDGLLGRSNSNSTLPTHWIVWEGPLTQQTNGTVNLKLFSWGEVFDQIKPSRDLSFFIKRFFGGMVFKSLK
ncbi:hypothetical protein ITX54_12450 [Rouxiella silvae]|uniref:Uncharacterized protein n=1 Tax=Rouxiella silvae TaxID=1646373 RepID=A0AA41BWR3_9GAMM|nr:hypothetical protein [Rouxiella silvae]MBF6637470.1 hypothetical protein [Rouxiella silvae]